MTARAVEDVCGEKKYLLFADGSANWCSHYENQYGDSLGNWELSYFRIQQDLP